MSYISTAVHSLSSRLNRSGRQFRYVPRHPFCRHLMPEITLFGPRQHEQYSLAPGVWMFGSGVGPAAGRPALPRLVLRDADLPEDQFQLDVREDGQLRLRNLGRSMTMEGGRRIQEGKEVQLSLPTRLFAAGTVIGLRDPEESLLLDSYLKTIPRTRDSAESSAFALFSRSPAPQTLVRWFEALGKLQQAAAGSAEFFEDAAEAVVRAVGLDSGFVMLRAASGWEIAASRIGSPETGTIHFQRRLVEMVSERRSTLFHDAQLINGDDLRGAETLVGAPIYDHRGEVAGLVYGVRSPGVKNQRVGIRRLEAQLVQLLAETMSVGMERQRRESEAARTRILLEQSFSPELARRLERNPELLEGQEREITILCSDLGHFFRIVERLGPHETYRILGDVMNRLTEAILSTGGVLIDAYGDGLAAMWNAPANQLEHAELACRAAQAILDELPAINSTWRETLGQDLALGIGIHSGPAQLGNVGNSRRIKYGPRGAVVNLAGSVERAAKRVGVPLLITEQTRRLLPANTITRRCLRARLSGESAPVDLFEVPLGPLSAAQITRLRGYEEALRLFESGNIAAASETLVELMQSPGDEDAAMEFLRDQIAGLRGEMEASGANQQTLSPPVVELTNAK